MFYNKKICVFGGTGTIGSLIVNYIRKENPAIIRVFSNDENSLWECQQEWGVPGMRYLLGDVRNLERVRIALKNIDYVFNCAAVKHVPYAEYNPLEAVEVNIIGLDNIIKASIERKVKKVLHISTDKAVEPTTVMGCTKMISERLTQIRWAQNPEVDFVIVRLGNVYGSRGSVISKVKKLAKEGKSITITNVDMERFFMQPEEVIAFIVKAFIHGKKGEIWVPRLTSTMLMEVIANEIGEDYPITIIGRRKGEKLVEILLTGYELMNADNYNQDYWILKNDYIF